MPKRPTPLKAWNIIRREWHAANAQVRVAWVELIATFQRVLENGCPPPAEAQVHECEKLEKTADFLSAGLDKLAHKHRT